MGCGDVSIGSWTNLLSPNHEPVARGARRVTGDKRSGGGFAIDGIKDVDLIGVYDSFLIYFVGIHLLVVGQIEHVAALEFAEQDEGEFVFARIEDVVAGVSEKRSIALLARPDGARIMHDAAL